MMQTSTLANISTTAGVNFEGVAANDSAPAGTTQFPYRPEKNFHAMYAQLVRAIETNDVGPFATGEDGLIATRIAHEAIKQI